MIRWGAQNSDDSEEEEDSFQAPMGGITRDDYTIGWICALPIEMAAAKIMLDRINVEAPRIPGDNNCYILGSIGHHNVVIACLPSGGYGTINAAVAAGQLQAGFPSVKCYLMVGIGGGLPNKTADIRLGDIVVSTPTRDLPGVIQYDLGKAGAGGLFERVGVLDKPPLLLRTAVSKLRADHGIQKSRVSGFIKRAVKKYPCNKANFTYPGADQDRLFEAEYDHYGGNTCKYCDTKRLVIRSERENYRPKIHYGLIASGNQVIKHGQTREKIAKDLGVYCVEMEAAGLMDAFPCLVIRGICDYSDSHKNKQWQGYTAAVAAAYAKELLLVALPAVEIEDLETIFLRSLTFREIDDQQNNIEKPLSSTCDWFFNTKVF